MIEVKNLYKSFGEKRVFDNAGFTVQDKSICGLVGINGAGKSTLLRILSGVMKSDKGCVTFGGEPVYDNEKVKSGIFFLADDPYYDHNVTGEKLRELYSAFYAFDKEIFYRFAARFNLNLKKPIRNFSKGMKRQVFVAIALACRPKYLFLDEAFDGLDPLARLEVKQYLVSLKENGSTIIIASHSLRELEDICDSFILIDEASVKKNGSIENALNSIFKLQLAFDKYVTPEQLPIEYMDVKLNGSVMTVIARGDKQQAIERIKEMNPILLEEIPMDLEDMFIEEIRERGYLK